MEEELLRLTTILNLEGKAFVIYYLVILKQIPFFKNLIMMHHFIPDL